jgi:hypothetical protein
MNEIIGNFLAIELNLPAKVNRQFPEAFVSRSKHPKIGPVFWSCW